MKYTVRRAVPSDFTKIIGFKTEGGKVDETVIAQSEEIRTFLCDDEPIMILGLVDFPSARYEKIVGLWGLFNKGISKHTKYVVKTCKDLLFDRVGYTFIALIDEDEKKFKRFVEFFGFRPTKEIEKYEEKVYRCYIKVN